MRVDTQVGEQRLAQGAMPDKLRIAPYSELVTTQGLPSYFELCRAGRLFTSMVKAVTIAATHNSPIAAATATPVIGLFNPSSSSRLLVPIRITCSTVSGTPAGGQFVLNAIPNISTQTTATITGSIFSHFASNSGASPQGSLMKPYNNVALAGIVPITSNELSIIGSAAAAAAAGNGGPGVTGEDLGGSFIFPPGTFFAIMAGSGAGTTWIVNASVTWAELDENIL